MALCLLAIVIADSSARIARQTLAALPDVNIAAEIDALTAQRRYAEAELLADAALNGDHDELGFGISLANPNRPDKAEIEAARNRATAERTSVVRRINDVGRGALTGQGDSIESLIGAIGSDLLVIGDVRDLLIQGAHLAIDQTADPVILALSVVGLATTLAPEFDWIPGLLKFARKAGNIGERLGQQIIRLGKAGGDAAGAGLRPLLMDVGKLSKATNPSAAIHLLRHADSAEDVAKLAAFTSRAAGRSGRSAAGFAAIHLTGGQGAQALLRAGSSELAATERALLLAARKGPAGGRLLTTTGRALLRAHPLLGLAKGLYKGNVQRAIEQFLTWSTPFAGWILAGLIGWVGVEVFWLRRKLVRTSADWQTG